MLRRFILIGALVLVAGTPLAAAITRVQTSAAFGDPASATFGSTPAEGNLLVVSAMERSGTGHANFTITGSGWTKFEGHDVELGNSSARRASALWWKTAGASEPTNIQIDNGTGNTKRVLIQEFNDSDGGAWTLEASTSNDNGTTTSAGSISTGTTASVGSGALLVLGALFVREGDSTLIGTPSWDNDLASATYSADGLNTRGVGSAFVEKSASGTYESTASFTGENNAGLSASIAVFAAGNLPR